MSTLNDLIASIHTSLHSYSGTQEQMTWLTVACGASDLTLTVASSDTILRGIAEIDDELIYVNTSDSNGLQLPPFGRGFRGSVAAAHPINSAVTFDPVFPRVEIRRAIDQAIEGLFPNLFQIKTTNLTFNGHDFSFSLPADAEGILSVKVDAGDGYWDPVSRWNFDPMSPLTNGKALNLMEATPVGAIRVTYRAKFGTFTSGTDTLASVGLSESYADLILYAVSARLIRFLDPARLNLSTIENVSRAGVVQSGDAAKIANQLYAVYNQRLAEERSRLLELTPAAIHFTR